MSRLTSLRAVFALPSAWRFEPEQHGRPRIVAPSTSLYFSLSHTRGLAACAIGVDLELGLDVEDTTRGAPVEVANRWFAPEELAELNALAPAEQSDRFFVYWTLKEAYIKAVDKTGILQHFEKAGIHLDLSSKPV